MKQEIYTINGVIRFIKRDFSSPKPISLEKSKKNLLDIKKVLDKNSVKFGLMFGTLLGAVRENNFIAHDEDIDLFVLEENRQHLLNSLHDLIKIGFEVCRYEDTLLSIMRDDEYIDFYFFFKYFLLYRKCSAGLTYKSRYLEKTIDYNFLGEIFQVPVDTEKFLEVLYGDGWRVPIKNDPSMSHSKYIIVREKIKSNFPFLFKIISKIKSKL